MERIMAVGKSGRLVVDIDPKLKRRLYAALTEDGTTLKDWFLRQCEYYLEHRRQGILFPQPRPPVGPRPEDQQ